MPETLENVSAGELKDTGGFFNCRTQVFYARFFDRRGIRT